MSTNRKLLFLIVVTLIIAGCSNAASSPTATEPPGDEPPKAAPGSSSNLPTDGTPVSNPDLLASPPVAAMNARQALADELGVPASDITFEEIEQVDWPDGCLGIHQPDMMCTQAIVPGYKVILEVDDQRYEYHTNLDGSYVLPATTPRPN
jgi:hypothetical protein